MNGSSQRPGPSNARRHSSQTLYGVLQIGEEASAEEVRRAYRRRALETHPDKLARSNASITTRRTVSLSSPSIASYKSTSTLESEYEESDSLFEAENLAKEKFREVHHAFEILGDEGKRKAYNASIGVYTKSDQEDFEKEWARYNQRNAERARERQSWAEAAEARHQERMRALREKSKVKREQLNATLDAAGAQAEIMNKVLEALSELSRKRKEESLKREQMKKNLGSQRRVVSEPIRRRWLESGVAEPNLGHTREEREESS